MLLLSSTLEKYSSIFLGCHFLVCSLGCPPCWMCCVYCNPPALLKDSQLPKQMLEEYPAVQAVECCGWSPKFMLSCANWILKVASHEADRMIVAGWRAEMGWKGHGHVVCMGSCVSALQSWKVEVLWLVGRWRCQSHCAPALNLHLMSLYHCLDDHINIMDLEERLFTRSLLLPDLFMCPVLKSLRRLWF